MIPVAGVGIVDGFGQQLGGEVTGDLSTVLGVFHIAAGSQHGHGPGSQASVGDVVVVGQLSGGDGDGIGHVVHQVHAGKGVALTGNVLVVAHQSGEAGGGVTVHAGDLVAVLQQGGKDVILGSDGGAIAPGQAVVDGDGVGLGAILILGFRVLGHHGGVELKLAFLGEGNSAVAVDQAVHAVLVALLLKEES